MRKSTSTTRSRFIRAGIAAGAVTVTLLAATATPALAAVAVTITPATGPAASAVAITASSAAGFHATTNTANFSTAATCPASATPNGTNIAAASVVTVSTSSLTFATPTTLVAPVAYKVCVYANGTLVNLTTTLPIFTASPARPVLSPATGPTGPITATLTGFLTTATTTPGVYFSPSATACTATFGTPTATLNASASATKTSADVLTFTQPSGVVSPNAYNVCIYGNVLAASTLLASGSTTYAAGTAGAVLNPATGLTGGGNTITATSALTYLNGVASPGVTFSTAACPATYTPVATFVATGINKLSDLSASLTVPTGVVAASPGPQYNVCFYNGTNAGISTPVAAGSTKYVATLPTVTLSANVGETATLTPITVTSATAFLSGVTPVAVMSVTTAPCSTTYPTVGAGIRLATAQKISNFKAVVTMPVTVAVADGPEYFVCIYGASVVGTSPLLGTSGLETYTASAAVTVTTVSPIGGPSLGGTKITVDGTGLPTAAGSITASIGGYPLLDVTPVSATAFTAITPAHESAPALKIKVVTAAGTFFSTGTYTYSNGLVVAPNTGPTNGAGILVDVIGVGFSALTFSNTTGTTTLHDSAHVYLVVGAYDPVGTGVLKNKAPIAECTSVLRISDTELICTVTTTGSLLAVDGTASAIDIPNGTYTLTVVSSGEVYANAGAQTADSYTQSVISSGSTFTVADY